MSTSAVAQATSGSQAARFSAPWLRWLILLLGAMSAGLLGAVVGEYAIGTSPTVLAIIATAGYLVGYLLASTHMLDVVAHLVSLAFGVLVSLVAIDSQGLWGQLQNGEWRIALDRYEVLLRGFIDSLRTGNQFDTDVSIFALGLTMWLVGYTSAWMLFRRGWVFWSLAVPGGILLATLAIERDQPTWPALIYLGLALAIAAAHTALTRTNFWAARSIEQPSSLGRRSVLFGSLIALLAVSVGLYYSFDLDNRLQERAIDRGDQLANWISERFDQSNSGTTGPQSAYGNYGAFADQFRVGEGVPTGDTPLVVVQSNGEHYLAARRLNEYDGSGWTSTTSVTSDDIPAAPRIAFQSDQAMNLPRSQLQHLTQQTASIQLLQPTDRLLFTIDQHYSASTPTLVRVGWEAIDSVYAVDSTDITEVPVDLRELIVLLQAAEFDTPSPGEQPVFLSAEDEQLYAQIRERMQQSYPVFSELSWSDSGELLLGVHGRLPVYSDVEAVYGAEEMAGASYSVVGMAPLVAVSDLELAGTGYPAFIQEAYLSLPSSVTQETRDLAAQIVADSGATNPYAQAIAIQNYLRSNFTYRLDAGVAPDGRDIVDYFLFDSRIGRCDHYASSMAVMLRSLGVPTRIVTGLSPVPFDSDVDGYVYRGRNAHAWVEVYFPEFGWIPFEPTPTQEAIDLTGTGDLAETTPEPTPTPASTESPEGTPLADAPTPTITPLPVTTSVDSDAGGSATRRFSPLQLGLGAAVAAMTAGLAGYLWSRRRAFAGMPVASANFGRLQRLGGFLGVQSSADLTPREYAAKFGAARPQAAGGAMQVADAYTRAQYATNLDANSIARESDEGWREAKQGANDWRIWKRR